jgi:hypothetical protein
VADLCSGALPLIATINGQNGKKVDVKSTVGVAGCGVAITKMTVKKRTVTLRVRVPAGGGVKISGKGLATVRKTFAKAGTYTLRTKLTKVGVKALQRALHRKAKKQRKLVLRLTASYSPRGGSSVGGESVKASRASKRITFKH